MPFVELKLNLLGTETVVEALQRVPKAADDFRPVFERILDELIDFETDIFSTEGAALGTKWAPLSPRYAARKKGPQIMVETGGLLASLTDKGSGNMISIIEPQRLVFGSAREVRGKSGTYQLAAIHQNPARSPVPQRRVMPENFDDLQRRSGMIDRWLEWFGKHLTGEL